jgi:signal transduction histidine kinase
VSEEYHEQVDAIIRNVTRLKEIIESLTSVDNYQSGGATLRQRKASIARIIEDVAASFQGMAAQKGLTFHVDLPQGNELLLDVDSNKIAVALSNLVKNAIMFTNEGGHVTIHGEQDAEYIKVIVKDDGVGIPAKDLSLIFDRFYQVESHLTRKHGGMGLGLSVAKAMVEMHGGQIWVDSEEGSGSTFTFLLPKDSKTPGVKTSPIAVT